MKCQEIHIEHYHIVMKMAKWYERDKGMKNLMARDNMQYNFCICPVKGSCHSYFSSSANKVACVTSEVGLELKLP